MRARAWLLLAMAATACLRLPSEGPPTLTDQTDPSRIHVDVVASGLQTPWALDFAPDGRLFLTERPGRIRIVDAEGLLQAEPWATVDVYASGESGLMGLALHPEFPQVPHVYVYATSGEDGSVVNRLVRFTEVDGAGVDPVVLLDEVPGESLHDGGRIRFGPDGLLYVTTGDAQEPTRAQDPESLGGKILRLKSDGSVPDGNLAAGSPVYTLGHRNAQGLCWQPGTGRLYATEHGPSTDDEVNLIEAGRNYGWPQLRGTDRADGFVAALVSWTPTIAPAGCTFYDSIEGAYEAWEADLFFVTLKETDLRRLVLDPGDARRIVGEEVLLDGRYGRLRDVIQGPDGALYVATSNRDGRGSPASDDDRILRVTVS